MGEQCQRSNRSFGYDDNTHVSGSHKQQIQLYNHSLKEFVWFDPSFTKLRSHAQNTAGINNVSWKHNLNCDSCLVHAEETENIGADI